MGHASPAHRVGVALLDSPRLGCPLTTQPHHVGAESPSLAMAAPPSLALALAVELLDRLPSSCHMRPLLYEADADAIVGRPSLVVVVQLLDRLRHRVVVRHRRRCGVLRDGHADGGADGADHLVVEVGREDDGGVAHLVDERVGLLHLVLRVEPLDHERVDVAHADRTLDVQLLEQLVAELDHLLRLGLHHLARAHEAVHVRDARLEARLLGLLALEAALLEPRRGLAQRHQRLLVVAVLVDLDLRAGVVEGGELLESLGLGVEGDDVLDDLRVGVPVEVLQVVGREDVDVARARDAREEDNLLGVARLEQALHRLDLVARLRVLLARQVVVALPLQQLAHLGEQRVARLLRLGAAVAERGQHALGHLL
mmetsp:Transcript_42325/g.117102  ORF Transcript_42325/g.117102 Transcript_42325/m.117102 type:complete len:369 (-) Transcript_42325:2513-3619(-)